MSFSPAVKDQVLLACARHCCICHKFCGIKIELHHIKQKSEGGKDTAENCIPLCFDCHGDMRSYDHNHPKGTKYTTSELIKHRDAWYNKISATPVSKYSEANANLDRRVVAKIKGLLPVQRGIQFIRSNNFAGFGFRRKNLDDFDDYLAECDNPEFEFIDAELEAIRADLTAAINDFMNAIATHTFSTGTGGGNIASVPQEWEFTNPSQFAVSVKEIHDSARRACSAYDLLLKAARRKLEQ